MPDTLQYQSGALTHPNKPPNNNNQLPIGHSPFQRQQPWGDAIHLDNPPHNIHILSHNINTLSSANNFLDWKAATQAIT